MKIYLITFFRQAFNHPKYLLINLFCLAIGIGSAFYIYLFVYKELNTDKFHANHESIYKVFSISKDGNRVHTHTSLPMGPYFAEQLAEVTDFTRVVDRKDRPFKYTIGENIFYDISLTQVDTNFFNIFDFEIAVGSLQEFKNSKDGVFITREIAEKFYGQDNPLGKHLTAEIPMRPDEKYEFKVIGILDDYPEESTIKPQILGNIKVEVDKPDNQYWGALLGDLYLVAPNTNAKLLSEKIKEIPPAVVRNSYQIDFEDYEARGIDEVYFFSANIPGNTSFGDQQLINVLIGIGISLLFLVGFNYIILNLGILTSRSQEIKTRRTLGASKRSVLIQFLIDSVLHVSLAFLFILLLYPLIIDGLSSFQAYQYSIVPATDRSLLTSFFGILLFMGLAIGSIVYFISTQIISFSSLSGRIRLRQNNIYQVLIQFQLVISIVAIACIFFLNRQMDLVKNADLGFDAENVVVAAPMRDDPMRQEISKLGFVEHIAHGSGPLSNTPRLDTITMKDDTKVVSHVIHSDHKFLDTYQISLIKGSNLNPDLCFKTHQEWRAWNNGKNAYDLIEVLVNERFVKEAGLEEPVGALMKDGHGFRNARIVGVMADFQNLPFYYNASPVVVGNRFNIYSNQIGIKVVPGTKDQLSKFLVDHYNKLGVGQYYDQLTWTYDFDSIYERELTLQRLAKSFTYIVILISCLGLFALNLFVSTSRTKEIGIRKVNGAKIFEILKLLNKDFIKWVVIAFVLAVPISWYMMSRWLENFAYKTELSWWVFALAGLLALGIALLTVSWQSWKAATRNPVEALRYE